MLSFSQYFFHLSSTQNLKHVIGVITFFLSPGCATCVCLKMGHFSQVVRILFPKSSLYLNLIPKTQQHILRVMEIDNHTDLKRQAILPWGTYFGTQDSTTRVACKRLTHHINTPHGLFNHCSGFSDFESSDLAEAVAVWPANSVAACCNEWRAGSIANSSIPANIFRNLSNRLCWRQKTSYPSKDTKTNRNHEQNVAE